MKHKIFLTHCYVFVFFIFIACSEETITPQETLFGKQFYPTQKGHTLDYLVEQITYKEFEPTDTSLYFLREEVGDTIDVFEPAGTSQQVFRYSRTDSLQHWELDSVWQVRTDLSRVIKVENNTPFIKLALPLQVNSTWNGNALNQFESQTYILESFLLPYNNFDRTFKVIHRQDSSLVDKRVAWEVYAEDIGLVESININLQYISDINDPFYGTDSIRRGVYIHQKIINFSE